MRMNRLRSSGLSACLSYQSSWRHYTLAYSPSHRDSGKSVWLAQMVLKFSGLVEALSDTLAKPFGVNASLLGSTCP